MKKTNKLALIGLTVLLALVSAGLCIACYAAWGKQNAPPLLFGAVCFAGLTFVTYKKVTFHTEAVHPQLQPQ